MPQERLSSAVARVAELTDSIKSERDQATATLKVLQKVPKSAEECARDEERVRKLLGDETKLRDSRVAEAVAELLAALDAYVERSRESFLRDFRDQAKERGIEAQLRDSVFLALGMRVIPDLAKGRCELRFGDELVQQDLPLEATRCLDTLVKQAKRLVDGREAPGKVLSTLLDAYLATCGIRQISSGEYAPIIDVMGQMVLCRQSPAFRRDPSSARFSEYSRADFSADLLLLQSSKKLETKGKRLHLQTAVIDTAGKASRSISVPGEEGRSKTYYQGLAFRAVRGGRS